MISSYVTSDGKTHEMADVFLAKRARRRIVTCWRAARRAALGRRHGRRAEADDRRCDGAATRRDLHRSLLDEEHKQTP